MKLLRWIVRTVSLIGAAGALTAFGVTVWYFNRPLPAPIDSRALFQGVTYSREIRHDPRPMVIHTVMIDLDAPGLRFLVTPRQDADGYVYTARTTAEFLDAFDLQLAVNGDFFLPWRDNGIWDYYPHSGDGVHTSGLSVSEGEAVAEGYGRNPATLSIAADNVAAITTAPVETYNAISGIWLIQDGQPTVSASNPYHTTLHPRTAAALDISGRTLYLVVVDGRQPRYSEGMTLPELADLLLAYGAYNAVNLDGGGSASLVIEDEDGQPMVLNSPVHSHIPGLQRPVANHLGVYAQQ